jgi:RimJ/RimL family protein N-acetyltransferase
MQVITLETKRLRLREWCNEDLIAFAKLNADVDVMRYFPKILSSEESDNFANKIISLMLKNGWGLWAVELKENATFIGYCGLHEPQYTLPCSPCVEIGWRFDKKAWGQGFATEATKEVLRFAFDELLLSEVVSFTTKTNKRSIAVMNRIGLSDTKQNFGHPLLSKNSPLYEHVLYKETR